MRTVLYAFIISALLIPSFQAQSPVPADAKLETVAGGFQFVEGPLWIDSLGLLFSDINGNTVYRWPKTGSAVAYVKPSGGGNGLSIDKQGCLLLAQQNARTVSRREPDGTLKVIASVYNGKKLNSPNDIIVRSDGSIFFTDPPYGISSNQEELGFYGIYRLTPNGQLQLLDKSLRRPNGLAFTPDEKKLYVGDSEANKIFIFDVIGDSAITNKKQFAAMSSNGYTDGMKVSPAGYLFAAGPLGIWVYDKNGALLDTILVPGQTSNCNWGDSDRQTLYITSSKTVYKIRIGPGATDVKTENSLNIPGPNFELLPGFPNPFNPATKIRYKLHANDFVKVSIYNSIGEKIKSLKEGFENAGEHEVVFNAENLTSGVYYCAIKCGSNVKVQKLVLIK